jgi:hypothetical protein
MSAQGSSVIKEGIRVVQGTPMRPLTGPTLFLRVLRVGAPGEGQRTVASLSVARPGATDYVIKELIPDMELDGKAALEKAIAIAKRGEVAEVYLNADLGKLPRQSLAATG